MLEAPARTRRLRYVMAGLNIIPSLFVLVLGHGARASPLSFPLQGDIPIQPCNTKRAWKRVVKQPGYAGTFCCRLDTAHRGRVHCGRV